MPTYEYQCTACRAAVEIFQSIKAKPERRCPSCGKDALERLISGGAAVLFKGSGFYQTDYRSPGYKEAAKAESGGGGGSGSGAAAGDSKPAAAGASKEGGSATPAAAPAAPAAPAAKPQRGRSGKDAG